MIAALGWIGSALIVLALTRSDLRQLHRINLIAALLLMVFNVAMEIPSMIALNVVLATVNSYKLWSGREHQGTLNAPRRPGSPTRWTSTPSRPSNLPGEAAASAAHARPVGSHLHGGGRPASLRCCAGINNPEAGAHHLRQAHLPSAGRSS